MLPTLFRLFVLFQLTATSAIAGPVHLLPAGPMVADGSSPVTIHVWIAQLDDADKVKIKPGHGKIASVKRFPGGIVAAQWVPAREGSATEIPLTVSIRRRGQSPEVVTLKAPLVPPREGSIAVTAAGEWEPNQEAVQLRFVLSGTSDQHVSDRRLLVNASTGTITEAVPLGDGTFSARWTPPASVPQARTVIITAADASAPSTITGWTSFPLLAEQSLTFGATPDSQNVLIIGDREYGPNRSSPAGTVAFSALMHPSVEAGTLRSTLPDGRSLDVPAPLPLAEYPRVSFFPQPSALPSGATHTILLAATTPSGAPLRNPTITVQTATATLGTAVPTTVPGVFALATQLNDTPGDLALTATMKDPAALVNKLQNATATIRIIPNLPSVSLSASPSPLPTNGKQLTFKAKVEDYTGAPMRRTMPGISALPGRLLNRTANRGNGHYDMKIRPEGDTATAIAVPRFEGSPLPAAGLVVWPAHAAVDTEGKVQVLAAVVDAFGHPVANQTITLTAPGGGTFEESSKSASNGIAVATYTASANPGLFTIRATASGFIANTGIFQGDAVAGPGPVQSGDSFTIARRSKLVPTVGTIRVNREVAAPPPPVVAAKPTVAAPAPPPMARPLPPAPAQPVSPAEQPNAEAAALTPPAESATPPSVTRRPMKRSASAASRPAKSRAAAAKRPSNSAGYDVTAALLGTFHSFKQTAEGESETLPPTASYTRTLAPGVRVNGNYAIDDTPWTASVNFRLINDVVIVGDKIHGFNNWSFNAGGSYRLNSINAGEPYLIAALERTQTTVFQSTQTTPLAPAAQSLYGARVGGGLVLEAAPGIDMNVSLSELMAPYPIATHVGARAFKPITESLSATAGIEADIKHISMSIDGVPLKVSDTEIGLHLGLTYESF